MLPSGVFNTEYKNDIALLRTKAHWFWLMAGLVLLFTLPLYASPYWLTWLTGIWVVVVAVLGLHVLTGLTGLFSMGQAAFVGVGAYVTAILASHGLSGWACLPLAALGAGVAGFFFGLPCFRLKGFYLAIATLAAFFIILWCVRHFDSVTGGFMGLTVVPLKLGSISFRSYEATYALTAVIMLMVTYFAVNLGRTSAGRCFAAIRDNELAAQVSGIDVFRYKMLSFFICCSFAGVAGWMLAYSQLRVTPEQFRLYDSIFYIGMIIVGGMGRISGVFFGVVLMQSLKVGLDELTPVLGDMFPSIANQLQIASASMVYSGIIIAFLLVQPQGLWYLWNRIKMQYRLHPYSY